MNKHLKTLSIKNIYLKLGKKIILKDISLDLKTDRSSDSIAIIGQSGSGKSAFLKCILGIYKANSGEITYHGKSIQNKNKQEFFQNLGMVFQNSALFDSLSIFFALLVILQLVVGIICSREKKEDFVERA